MPNEHNILRYCIHENGTDIKLYNTVNIEHWTVETIQLHIKVTVTDMYGQCTNSKVKALLTAATVMVREQINSV